MSTFRERLRESFEERTGYTVEKTDRLQLLEQSDVERRALQRELDLLSYTALNVGPGKPQEIRPEVRRKLAERSRLVWMKDPQVGAAVDLTCDFVFGRGVNKPKANDPQVQEVLDETWDDPDNQLVLTSHGAQLALLVDLLLQSNLFFLVFEDGEDGKVKLGLLDHDTVETVVRDSDNRLRILYYMARHFEQEWDFKNDRPVTLPPGGQATGNNGKLASAPTTPSGTPTLPGQGEVKYYEHWRNLEDATQDADSGARTMPTLCPPNKLGSGKVFHVSINRGTEMAFGHPVMDRVLRWASAYNVFLDARVDMMSAAAAFVMKRKVKGTPQQLQRMATQALSRRSMLGMSMEPGVSADVGPKAAGVITENDSVDHEPFALNTNAPQAQVDAQMLHGQISAATRWPLHYMGDQSQSNLATSTSLELPILKLVERFQELFETAFRFLFDRAIERAVDVGKIDEMLDGQAKTTSAKQPAPENLEPSDVTQEAYEGEQSDEDALKRDLGYEFSMPQPLKRMIGDIVTAAQLTAEAFDPNNSNTELSRTLLAIVLGEGFELEDPAGAVERIFPQGYVDPATQAAAGAPGGGGPGPFGEFGQPNAGFSNDMGTGSMGSDPQNGYGGGYGAGNPYGAVAASQSPEVAMQQSRADEIDARLEAELKEILAEGD